MAPSASTTRAPSLRIRLKKSADGSAALSCTRADGTVTWHRQDGAHARFFPRHDLTHFAVETVLGHRRGFYGLVAEGWNITDFGYPWPRGPVPDDAEPAEAIVGFLDAERAGGEPWTAASLSEQLSILRALNGTFAPATVDEHALARIRSRMAQLFAAWEAVSAGGTLELRFEPAAEVPQDRPSA